MSSDDFNRANGSLGAAWTGISGQAFMGLQIAGGQVTVPTYQEGQSQYTGASLGGDQFTELQYQGGLGVTNLVVRASQYLGAGAWNGYEGQILDIGGPAIWRIIRMDHGAETVLASGPLNHAVGDTFYFEAVGSTLTVKRNGVTLGTASDARYADGDVGFGLYNRSSLRGDNWRGGEVGGGQAINYTSSSSSSASSVTSTANSAPVISGAPPANSTVGIGYSFSPVASDVDGDALTFSIQNKPVWAGFNAATGQLTGTPTAGNVGTYENVVITVSDGRLSRSLPAFTIMVAQIVQSSTASSTASRSALVSWGAPLVNADGSMLRDLTGFNLYYGQDPANLNHVIQLDCGWCLWHQVNNLGPGTWYFSVKAYNKYGLEGDSSALVSKSIF